MILPTATSLDRELTSFLLGETELYRIAPNFLGTMFS